MRITLQIPLKKDLTGKEVMDFDSYLRRLLPELLSWSFSPGILTLDFGDDESLIPKIKEIAQKVNVTKILNYEFLGEIKEWQE